MNFVRFTSQFPAWHPTHGDAEFFRRHPKRRFRARDFVQGEAGLPIGIATFADDGAGGLAELTVVIVVRLKTGRKRMPFAANGRQRLNSDREIASFLRSRGIDPNSLDRLSGW